MTRRVRLAGIAVATVAGGAALALGPVPVVPGMPVPAARVQDAGDGFPIESQTIIDRCSRCHEQDDEGRMTRISWSRRTPEGWQTAIRRMVSLHDVRLEVEEAREIVRYLANRQGIAPDELEPARFEVERRLIDHDDWDGPDDVEQTCIQCHSLGRIMTQRRTKEEWGLIVDTHRGLYPLTWFMGFRRLGEPEPGEDGAPPDPRQPMEKAIDHFASVYPLETPEWSAWSATMRPPRLAGTWAVEGFEPGRGRVFGTMTIAAGDSPDAFTTRTELTYAETGRTARADGESLVYTGYQWRGRSEVDSDAERREVMTVDRDWETMTGRWFQGAYDELGRDVTLRRIGAGTQLSGVHPFAVGRGGTVEVTVYGANLPDAGTDAWDFGPGVSVASAGPGAGSARLRLEIGGDARLGTRDLFAGGVNLREAIVIHDGVHRIEVTPRAGLARVGGGNFPKQFQVFDATGWNDGPDGEPRTGDDLALGRVPVTWSLEEYAATYGDDDIDYAGSIDPNGLFTPALDGPNPERSGNRNNVGDLWVVATYAAPDGEAIRARANLIVTVPLYARFDPWRPVTP